METYGRTETQEMPNQSTRICCPHLLATVGRNTRDERSDVVGRCLCWRAASMLRPAYVYAPGNGLVLHDPRAHATPPVHLWASPLPKELPVLDISVIPDQQLVNYLCRTRAVFPFPKSDDDIPLVECLLPLLTVFPYRSQLEYIIVRSFADDEAPLTVMQTALVRDCLKGANRERLDVACSRSCWRVTTNDYYAGHCLAGCEQTTLLEPSTW